jgi:hypothetical protein
MFYSSACTKPRSQWSYTCVLRGIDFAHFYDFDIWFWNCYDSVVFLFFILFDKMETYSIDKYRTVCCSHNTFFLSSFLIIQRNSIYVDIWPCHSTGCELTHLMPYSTSRLVVCPVPETARPNRIFKDRASIVQALLYNERGKLFDEVCVDDDTYIYLHWQHINAAIPLYSIGWRRIHHTST